MGVLTLNKLAKAAYEASVSKGWYESPKRSDEEIAQLIISEIVEATEEVRNKRPPVYIINKGDGAICPLEAQDFVSCEYRDGDKPVFYMKPEGESVELGDGLIRIGDYFGAHGWDLAQAMQQVGVVDKLLDLSLAQVCKACSDFMEAQFAGLSPLACHLKIERMLTNVDAGMSARRAFGEAGVAIAAYAHLRGYDLEASIKLKMEYNSKREYRHGGKAL